ncbi:MAG: alpha/beta hydrolase [Beijerinckiaceae bacterium]|nr:alpha/beta hydrolase [Beijerinckiaceae bacterium]
MIEELAIESRFLSAPDGLKLHARDYGSSRWTGAPVLCLPGLSRTAADFDVIARALAQGAATRPRRVVALDYRGRGLSDRDPDWKNYDLRVENADILACMDALSIEHAIFLGTSRGGLHTMMTAATRPGVIKAAILNDIGPVIEAQGLARIRGYIGKLATPHSWSDAVDLVKRVMGGQFTSLSEDDWLTYAQLTFEEANGKFAPRYDARLMKTLESLDLEAPLPNAWPQFEGLGNVPTLCLRGENSDLLSPVTVAEMGKRHPRFEAHTVAGQAHAPLLLDEPTIKVIADFITRCES